MSPVETQCPSCGAPIRFALGSSVVTVCANCRSVVARGDQRLEDLGKVAVLADTGSPLEVGRKGNYRGMPFELTGRAQFAHEAGSVWDEWYASFPNDRWGWLAEAQGKFYLTFARHLPAGAVLPDPKQIELGHKFTLPGVGMLVANEIGRATAKSAEGEIPYRLVPGAPLDYIDLTGGGGKFATFDYGDDPPTVYLGQEVTLDDLGISPAAASEREPQHVGALQVNCPNCGGVLDLKAPDVTERVACPYCNSLLDCTQGKLQFLEALKQKGVKPLIPLGTVGTIEGESYTVIGFLLRHVLIDGTKYPWQEFLLYSAGHRVSLARRKRRALELRIERSAGRSASQRAGRDVSGPGVSAIPIRAGGGRSGRGGVLLEGPHRGASAFVGLHRSPADAVARDFGGRQLGQCVGSGRAFD